MVVTDRIAVYLGVVLALAMGADVVFNDGIALMFLAHKFLDLVEWTAFWR